MRSCPGVLVEAQASADARPWSKPGNVDTHDTRGGVAREADVDALVAVGDVALVDGLRQVE